MRTARIHILTVLFVATTGGQAIAGNVLTTPLVERWGASIGCTYVNAGTTPVTVELSIVNRAGVEELGPFALTTDPGVGDGFLLGDAAGAGEVYCRFRVMSGRSRNVRASACVIAGPPLASPCAAMIAAQ